MKPKHWPGPGETLKETSGLSGGTLTAGDSVQVMDVMIFNVVRT